MSINLYYHKSINFGDMLSPYLVTKLAKVKFDEIRYVNFDHPEYKYVFTGSLLCLDKIQNAKIFGAGFAFSNSYYLSENVNISLIRGELSLKKVIEQKDSHGNNGITVDTENVVGEPSLILPNFYNPCPEKKYKLGLIPHIVDYEKVKKLYEKDNNVLVIDLFWRSQFENFNTFIERVLFQICQCERTISSSLHGVIVSVAYSVPSDWCEFSKGKIIGDGFKYYDFIQSVSSKHSSLYSPVNLTCNEKRDYNDIISMHRSVINDKINPVNILNKNPF